MQVSGRSCTLPTEEFRTIGQEEVATSLKVGRFAAVLPRLFGEDLAVAELAIDEKQRAVVSVEIPALFPSFVGM